MVNPEQSITETAQQVEAAKKPKKNLAQTTIRGTIWIYASNYSGKFLVFLSTVILARLLSKQDFGVASYAIVVIGFLDVLTDLGVGPALIYHKDDPKAADTAFWLNIGFGIVLFAITFLCAPLVGMFFNDPRAIPVTRVLALSFPISAIGNIQNTLLQKRLKFKKKFIPDFTQSVAKGLISIVLAWQGFGAWSLIIGQVCGIAVSEIVYWNMVDWRPSFTFARNIAGSLLKYGLNIVAVNMLGVLLLNIDYLFVGRFLGPEALAVYTLAFRVPELLIKQFCGILGKVLFPVYTTLRDDEAALRRSFLATMRYVSMLTFPMAIGLAVVAPPFIQVAFGSKWIDAASVMPAIALYTLLRSLSFNIGDVYKAQGRPEIITKMSVPRLVTLAPALWWAVTVPGTIVAVGWVQFVSALLSMIVSLIIAARLLKTPVRTMLATCWPATIASLAMAPAVILVLQLLGDISPIVQLIVGVAIGALTYLVVLWLVSRDTVMMASTTLRSALIRR